MNLKPSHISSLDRGLYRSALCWLALAVILASGVSSRGSTLYYDGDGTGASGDPPTSGVGGAGTWDNSNNNWWNGSSYQEWDGPGGEDIAEFRPTVGAVTISGTVNANQLIFTNTAVSVSGYSLSGGTINLTGAATIQVHDTLSGAANVTINSAITGNNGLTKTGVRRVVLGGSNLYTGDTVVGSAAVYGGIIDLSASAALPSTSVLDIQSGFVRVYPGVSAQVAGLSGLANGYLTGQGAGGGTLTMNRNDGGVSTFNGRWDSVKLNLVKAGNYTQILGGTTANSNAGTPDVRVEDGTLALAKTAGLDAIPAATITLVGGTLRLDAANQINDAATMDLSGGTVNVQGSTDTIDTLTASSGAFTGGAGALTAAGGVTVTGSGFTQSGAQLITPTLALGGSGLLTLSGGTNKVTQAGGGLSFTSGGVFDFDGGTLALDGAWDLDSLLGIADSTFTVFGVNGDYGRIQFWDGNGDYAGFTMIQAIPEPSTLLLIAAGGWVLFRWRRRGE